MFDRRDMVTVKFRDGLRLRVAEAALTDRAEAGQSTVALDEMAVLLGAPFSKWEPVHESGPAAIDALRALGEANTGQNLPDLNLQMFVYLAEGTDPETALDTLNALNCVEMALPAPLPVRPPVPPILDMWQDELPLAPGGIAARTVWAWPGNGPKGQGVRIADIEYSWNLLHVDLPSPISVIGSVGTDPFGDKNHGTAVLGQMVALNNGWGTVGASYGATASVVYAMTPTNVYNLAGAISRASVNLAAGDIILIEQQTSGPLVNASTPSTQFGLVPVEWYKPYYDAIKVASAAGRVVVEPAANGQQNLDLPAYSTGNGGHYPFLPQNDSGAIIVGAGCPPRFATSTDRSRLYFSNYGTALSVQAAGEQVVTLGYGDFSSVGGVNEWYTGQFGGTSSASPIVASAVAILQGMHKQALGTVLTPAQVRAALMATGSAQQSGTYPSTQRIGPRPNVQAAAFHIFGPGDCDADGIPNALEPLTVAAWVPTVATTHDASAQLTVSGSGSGALLYRWEKGALPLSDGEQLSGSTIEGATTPILAIEGVRSGDAGVYTCRVTDACSLEAVATVELVVSGCPGDFNDSGTVSIDDLFLFLNAWFNADPQADMNQNGVTIDDLFLFLNAWFTGC